MLNTEKALFTTSYTKQKKLHWFQKKHPLTFFFVSPWKMFRFPQIFQGMSRRKLIFHQWKVSIFCYWGHHADVIFLHL